MADSSSTINSGNYGNCGLGLPPRYPIPARKTIVNPNHETLFPITDLPTQNMQPCIPNDAFGQTGTEGLEDNQQFQGAMSSMLDILFDRIDNPPVSAAINPNSQGALRNSSSETELISYKYRHLREFHPSSVEVALMKRKISDRQAGQKYRLKKMLYVAGLEKKVKTLEEYVSLKGFEISEYHRLLNELRIQNNTLQQQLAILESKSRLKEDMTTLLTLEKDQLSNFLQLMLETTATTINAFASTAPTAMDVQTSAHDTIARSTF